jgi:hypothetical protein
MSTVDLVNAIIDSLASKVDSSDEIRSVFREAITPVVEEHFAALARTSSKLKVNIKPVEEDKKKKKRADRIPVKNGYHFYVAANMHLVNHLDHSARMAAVAALWKDVDPTGRAPYELCAERYNQRSRELQSEFPNWVIENRLTDIKATCQAYALEGSTVRVNPTDLTTTDDLSTVVTTASVAAPVPTPAPVPAPVETTPAPAPVAAPVPAVSKPKKARH